ncbi:MAG: hypothetical protein ACOCSK_03190 [Rhodothermales bacterium]
MIGDKRARASWAMVDSGHNAISKGYRHKKVEDGLLYGFYTDELSVSDGSSLELLIQTGSKDAHIILSALSGEAQTIPELYEDTEVSSEGDELLASNFNRNYPDTPELKVYTSPTVTNDGFRFVSRRILSGGQGPFKVSSEIVDGIERVLKAQTNYLVKVTADGGAANIVVTGVFYEEETQ